MAAAAVREEIEVMLYASGSYAFVLKDGMASGQAGGVGAVVKEGGVRPSARRRGALSGHALCAARAARERVSHPEVASARSLRSI